MKTSRLFFTLVAFLLFLKTPLEAQIGIGAGYNYTKYLGDFGQGNSGLNFRLSYNRSEKGTINGGFIYGLPLKFNYQITATASSNQTDPFFNDEDAIEVDAAEKISFKTFYLNYNYFFLKDNEEPFGMYGIFGAGLVAVSSETEIIGKYDKSKYNLAYEPEKESYFGFMIHLGLGTQFNFGPLSVFGEGLIGIPANRVNNQEVENVIPFNAGVNVGTKYTFGSGGGSSVKSKGNSKSKSKSKKKKKKSKKRRR